MTHKCCECNADLVILDKSTPYGYCTKCGLLVQRMQAKTTIKFPVLMTYVTPEYIGWPAFSAIQWISCNDWTFLDYSSDSKYEIRHDGTIRNFTPENVIIDEPILDLIRWNKTFISSKTQPDYYNKVIRKILTLHKGGIRINTSASNYMYIDPFQQEYEVEDTVVKPRVFRAIDWNADL